MKLNNEELVKEIIDETPRWATILRRKAQGIDGGRTRSRNPRNLLAEGDHSGSMTSKEVEVAIAELKSLEEFAEEQDLKMMGLSDMLEASIRGSF